MCCRVCVSINDDDRPLNILLVVWDACRYDHAVEHASYLNTLASSNVWFENAIAPSPWSLPSHASIFTGEYPHEHRKNRLGDSLDATLARELSDRGYICYGVSANGFASQRTGFHEGFDEFRYTGGRDVFVDGMDVSGTSQAILREDGRTQKDALRAVLRQLPGHDHSLKSLANLITVSCGELATKFDTLQRISHPAFAPTSDYSYTPEKNTRVLQSILEDHEEDEPFFIFTNYMDTHRCYKPLEALQEKHLGRSLGYRELVRLNEEVAATWPCEEKKARGELDESDVEDLRGLYAGEVETVDSHLGRVHQTLEDEGLLKDTLVVVTADHGENLGKTDEMGRQRMGHVASVSDAVLRVPLVVAHPDISERTVSRHVSITDLYGLFLSVGKNKAFADGKLPGLVRDGPVTSQYPATGGLEETIEKYPDAPEAAIRHRSSEDSVVVYDNGWKVVAESTGERWASKECGETGFSAAPEELQGMAEAQLQSLSPSTGERISDEQVSQLESLGYL